MEIYNAKKVPQKGDEVGIWPYYEAWCSRQSFASPVLCICVTTAVTQNVFSMLKLFTVMQDPLPTIGDAVMSLPMTYKTSFRNREQFGNAWSVLVPPKYSIVKCSIVHAIYLHSWLPMTYVPILHVKDACYFSRRKNSVDMCHIFFFSTLLYYCGQMKCRFLKMCTWIEFRLTQWFLF